MHQATQIIRPLFSPHLKSNQTFEWTLIRESLGTLTLFLAALFLGKSEFAFLAIKILFVAGAADFLLRKAGYSASPRWDSSLLNHALLLSLFVPTNTPMLIVGLSAFVLAVFYRACGGRVGYVLQPVCLSLAFLLCLGTKVEFSLTAIHPLFAGIVFVLWVMIRFPRTQTEAQHFSAVLGVAILLNLLHHMALTQAVLWSVVACDLIFDPALAPLTKIGRGIYHVLALLLFALLLVLMTLIEAMILTGLTVGFFASRIEEWNLTRKTYESKKPH